MQRKKMTDKDIERFPITAEDKARSHPVLWDGDEAGCVKGLGLRYSAKSGTRTFFLQYRVRGTKQERQIKIGSFGAWNIKLAREKAQILKKEMDDGIDPTIKAKEQERERKANATRDAAMFVSLRQMLEHYLENKRTKKKKPLRPATKVDMRRSIEVNLKDWLDKPMVTTITRDTCRIRFMELSKRAPSSANLTMIYLRGICNYTAQLYEDDEGIPTIMAANPVARMIKNEGLNDEKPRTRRIPLSRVGHAWLALQRLRTRSAARSKVRTAADLVCCRFLTGMRKTESGSLKWSQVDLIGKTITLLGDISKNHNPMVLPISDALCEILTDRAQLLRKDIRSQTYVFSSVGKREWMSNPLATMEIVSKAAGLKVSAHDFRRTVCDLLEVCKVSGDQQRQLLNHLASDVHGQSYSNNPDPEMLRPAVDAIANYVVNAAKVAEAQENGSNIISLRGHAPVSVSG